LKVRGLPLATWVKLCDPIGPKRLRAITKEADHEKKVLYIGLDVYKNTIDIAIATGRSNGKLRSYGKINNTLDAPNNLVDKPYCGKSRRAPRRSRPSG
jgi:hypothetical protein